MAELSPAAQAVLDAWLSSERGERMLGDPCCLAVALLAVCEQVAPMDISVGGGFRMHRSAVAQRRAIRAAIIAIAIELKGPRHGEQPSADETSTATEPPC